MNKKIKIKSQRKVLQLSATFFIGIILLSSCKKEFTNVGDGLESGSLSQHQTDTFTLQTYTEVVDSLKTDETAVSLLGSYVDPTFGKVDCGIVTQVRMSSVAPEFGPTATLVMDSVVLALKYTSINFYANIEPIKVEVYRLNEDIDRENGTYYAFNTPVTTGPNLVLLGSEVITPDIVKEQIVGTDTLSAHLRIKLDPSFGDDMVAGKDAGNFASDESFATFFKGLVIKVDGSSLGIGQGCVLYFSLEHSLSNLTMYFHDSGDNIAKTFTFNINAKCARYNDIKFDRTGTHVEQVLLDPTKGSEAFYMQGSSLRAAVKIPHLMNFNYDSLGNWDPKIINKAVLILPIQDFTNDPFDPSASLFIAKIVDDNVSSFTLDYVGSSQSNLSTVKYDQVNKEYQFLVTRELQGMLSGEREFSGFRIYIPSFFGSSIERIVFNGSNTSFKEKPRLEITYTNY